MANNPNLALRFSESDKAALLELSARLQRSQSDTIRFLVRESLTAIKQMDQLQARAGHVAALEGVSHGK